MERSKLILHNETSMSDTEILKKVVIPVIETGEDRPGVIKLGERFKLTISDNPRSKTYNVAEANDSLEIVRISYHQEKTTNYELFGE